MKITSRKQLKSYLEGNPLPPIALVVASEVEEREGVLRLLAPNPSVVFDVGSTQAIDELYSRSLFESEKVVLFKGVEKWDAEKLISYTKAPSPFVRLVMVANTLPPTSPLKKGPFVVEIASLRPWELEGASVAYLVEGGVPSEPARLLVARVGIDKSLLRREVEKLTTYCGSRAAITTEAVSKLAVGVPTEKVWDLGAAILTGQAKRALNIWRDLSFQGMAHLSVLAAIRTKFHTALGVASCDAKSAKKAFPRMSEKQLFRTGEEAKRYGVGRLGEALVAVSELELTLKNSQSPADVLMEMLIVRLC